MGWVNLVHPETGGRTRVPDSPDVLAWHEARGWKQDSDGVTVTAVPPVSAMPGQEWMQMRHPESGGVQEVPADPTVVAAQQERGWVLDDTEDPAVPEPGPVQQEKGEPAAVGADTEGEPL